MTDTTAERGRKPRGAKGSAAPKPVYSEGYKTLVLVLLVVAYTLSFIDRTIIATIGQGIKDDLKITDTQLGMLGGLYFALLYTLLGIPIARLAERLNRVTIISISIAIWSAFTALCGTAGSFAQLALYRFGVGIGEAGLSPPAHSLISDYYEPKRRSTALAIYSFGIPLGAMLGAVIGGFILDHFTWRTAFMVVGLPGLITAIAMKLLIKEPPRGHSEPEPITTLPEDVVPEEHGRGAPPFSLTGELKELGAVAGVLFTRWPILCLTLGVTIVSMGGYGAGQFAPPYFLRTFHLSYGTVGLITGLAAGIGQGIGTLAGGFLTDRLAKWGPRWYALVPAIGIAAAYPIIVAVYTAPTWQMAAALIVLPGILSYTYLGPSFGVVQNMVPSHRRATATAILFFFLNLIALGGGPPMTGWIIDHFAAFHHAHPDLPGLWNALSGFGGGAESFQAICPGGKAPVGADAAAGAACGSALVLATREGIILTYALGLVAAVLYFVGSFGLPKALARARAERGEAD
jgi:MFS family permease